MYTHDSVDQTVGKLAGLFSELHSKSEATSKPISSKPVSVKPIGPKPIGRKAMSTSIFIEVHWRSLITFSLSSLV